MGANYDSFLNQIPIFNGLPPDQMLDVMRMLRPVKFQPGELIFREGEEGRAAYVLQSGNVEIFVQAKPSAIVVSKLGPGEIFGELALIDGSPRSAGARALSACEILYINKEEFDFLRAQMRPVAFHLLRKFSAPICERIRDTNDQIDQILVSGRNIQRGGAVVTSARVAPPQEQKKKLMKRLTSLFKR